MECSLAARALLPMLVMLALGCSGQLPHAASPAAVGDRSAVLVITDIDGDEGEATRAELMSELTQLDEELGGTPFGTVGGSAPLKCWSGGDPGTLFARCNAEAQAIGASLGADGVLWGRVVGKNTGIFQLYWSLPNEAARMFHPAHGQRRELSWADFAPLLGDVLLGRASRGAGFRPGELEHFAERMQRTVQQNPAIHGFTSYVRGELALLQGDTLLALAIAASDEASERSDGPSAESGNSRAERYLVQARAAYRRALDAFGVGGSSDVRAAAESALARTTAELGRRTDDPAMYREAIDAYDGAAKLLDKKTAKAAWEAAQSHAANLELELGQRLGDEQLLARAVRRNREIVAATPSDTPGGAGRGAALNNLCAALTTQASASQTASGLEGAVKACSDAADAAPRADQPLVWAGARRNLGNALTALALAKPGGDELERAIAAYTDARAVYGKQRQKLDWADASLAIGSAQASLGAGKSNPDLLLAALHAYDDAETVRTKSSDPTSWAMIESNRAETLYLLGKLSGDPEPLRRAAGVLKGLADATSRVRRAAEWARIQHNLGSVLGTLGERTGEPDELRKATAALRAALEVRTRSAARDEWAASELALGQYAHSLAQLTGDNGTHSEAVAALRAALTVYAEDPKSSGWAKARTALASSLVALGRAEPNPHNAELTEASEIARHTADVVRSTLPEASADAELTLGAALEAQVPENAPRSKATRDTLCEALSAYLSGWAVAVERAPDPGETAAQRIRALLGRTRKGQECPKLPKDAWARFRREAVTPVPTQGNAGHD